MFGGSGTVSVNMTDKFRRITYNELDPNIYEIVKFFKNTDPDQLCEAYEFYVNYWNLGKTREEEYYKFRENYRENPHIFKLFVLSKHSFSSLIRFNNGVFNMPWGRRGGPSTVLFRTIRKYNELLQGIKLSNKCYQDYLKYCFDKGEEYCDRSIFYFDPPYYASGANVYAPPWSKVEEKAFIKTLDSLNERGIKFVLSNTLRHRNKKNPYLKRFIKQNNFTVICPSFGTKGQGYTLNRATDTIDNQTHEILLKNF